jgi:hypothetical protein
MTTPKQTESDLEQDLRAGKCGNWRYTSLNRSQKQHLGRLLADHRQAVEVLDYLESPTVHPIIKYVETLIRNAMQKAET